MASPTQCTKVWANSGRQWRTGKPAVLQSMGLQRVGHDLLTEQSRKAKRGMSLGCPRATSVSPEWCNYLKGFQNVDKSFCSGKLITQNQFIKLLNWKKKKKIYLLLVCPHVFEHISPECVSWEPGCRARPPPQKLHTGAVFVLLGSESSASRMCEVPDLSAGTVREKKWRKAKRKAEEHQKLQSWQTV